MADDKTKKEIEAYLDPDGGVACEAPPRKSRLPISDDNSLAHKFDIFGSISSALGDFFSNDRINDGKTGDLEALVIHFEERNINQIFDPGIVPLLREKSADRDSDPLEDILVFFCVPKGGSCSMLPNINIEGGQPNYNEIYCLPRFYALPDDEDAAEAKKIGASVIIEYRDPYDMSYGLFKRVLAKQDGAGGHPGGEPGAQSGARGSGANPGGSGPGSSGAGGAAERGRGPVNTVPGSLKKHIANGKKIKVTLEPGRYQENRVRGPLYGAMPPAGDPNSLLVPVTSIPSRPRRYTHPLVHARLGALWKEYKKVFGETDARGNPTLKVLSAWRQPGEITYAWMLWPQLEKRLVSGNKIRRDGALYTLNNLLPMSRGGEKDQRKLFDAYLIDRYGSVRKGRKWLAFGPGAHSCGLAVDFGIGNDPGFMQARSRTVRKQRESKGWRWFVNNAHKFGFTPYKNEPWHWEVKLPYENYISGKEFTDDYNVYVVQEIDIGGKKKKF